MYKFKDEYRTGIDFIDEQHKVLFEIADKTYNLLKNDFALDKYDRIVGLIEELQDYTAFHFNAEEEYMQKINYKRMFTQKVAHDAFIKRINDVNFSKIDENQEEYITKILQLLNDWLTEHILENDMLIGK
ncbi:bacteriohemerythrin [Clostridium chromiireducens]|uniref:Bacteriohemerythrin n=1 Tax=Clostridium chromiireducens TaxID=225345 RepID=A0A1V4IDE4_9CLOT|nr:hemerythrin family protein [Clostridium chromiireducens]MVX63361.1 bacteriohemerythrin [Clostridium chromiireducens]OPJ57884.1 bacteriohemerythrin [Clostridium chromiireducens]RII35547.1 bacteriohemerythrin [Clostridium chromiireducens]